MLLDVGVPREEEYLLFFYVRLSFRSQATGANPLAVKAATSPSSCVFSRAAV